MTREARNVLLAITLGAIALFLITMAVIAFNTNRNPLIPNTGEMADQQSTPIIADDGTGEGSGGNVPDDSDTRGPGDIY